MPLKDINVVHGSFASTSRRRDSRYKPAFSIYVQRTNGSFEPLNKEIINSESAAMKILNKAFNTDITIERGNIIEYRTVRTYHRHVFNEETGLCNFCWGKRG